MEKGRYEEGFRLCFVSFFPFLVCGVDAVLLESLKKIKGK